MSRSCESKQILFLKDGLRASVCWLLCDKMSFVGKLTETCFVRCYIEKTKVGFQDKLSLNAGRKYCRMLKGEHSAILLTFIKLPFVIKIFVLSIFEWPFYTDITVCVLH